LAEWAIEQGGLAELPLSLRLRLLTEVASAVAAAHQLGVLHKDLKPGNILVAADPDGEPRIKVADFGCAALLEPARLADLGITNLGFTHTAGTGDALTGTVMYVAPEVLAGQSPTSYADVYALGVLLYQLVAGDFRKPIAPGWEDDVPEPLLREDIGQAASGDPAKRRSSAAELAERLSNLDQRILERRRRDEQQHAASIRPAPAARRPSLWLVLGAASLLFLAMAAAMMWRRSFTPRVALRTVAVLPFQNAGSDASVDFLRLALPDEIASALGRVPGIAVRPFASTSRYGASDDIDLQKAAREMAVKNIVTGRFWKSGEQLHIALETIDVET
jgi:serine/threonine protein kinase